MIKTASQQQMKQTNTKAVYQLIRERKSISRAAIAKMTKLSPTTISTIVEDLIAKGIVVERSLAESSGAGRKAIQLELSDSGKYLIGVEMDHQSVSGTLFNLKNEAAVSLTEPFQAGTPLRQAVAETDAAVARKLMQQASGRFDEPIGLCVGVPGVLDKEKRAIVFSSILPVENVPIGDQLAREFPFPVFIENETLLAATAEWERLEHKPSPFIYLSINEGLGASVIVNNRYLQGVNGEMLEIGHMSLDTNGELCACGNRGCFELQVSIPALDRIVRRLASQFPDSPLGGGGTQRPAQLEKAVAAAAESGDPLARQAVADIAGQLGDGLVNLVNIFNPETIVIGGRLSALGDELLDLARQRVSERALKPFAQQCRIVPAGVKGRNIAAGAGYYALHKALERQM